MPHTFARIENGKVTEIVTINDGEPGLDVRYHAAIVEHFIELRGAEQYTIRSGWNYDGSGFSDIPHPVITPSKRYVKVSVVRERMEVIGKWDNLVAILQTDMPKLMKVLTLDSGIDPEDPEARGMITLAGADPSEILRI